jgi:hypothetical protein
VTARIGVREPRGRRGPRGALRCRTCGRSARGTEAAALAGECDEPLAAAVLAAHAEKASAEKAAVEEGAELALDEAGDDAALIAGGGEEGLEVALHDAVENGALRRAPLVLQRIGQVVSDEDLARHGREPVRAACLHRDEP